MKVIAMYLPQFHRVPENDEWWGEGYTEWTAVKQAEKLFPEHYQPHIPLNNNYYDLLQKSTMQWQAELMREYDVYGMCFYHYYFKNGKRILEKPAENLLKWKDIVMPFCFSWANETWARTWSKISDKNIWNSCKEVNNNDSSDGILLKQEYGTEKDWREHFEYLVPFFQDERYIKINGAPIFIIHKPDSITCLPQMMEKWNMWAKQYGWDKIVFIGTNSCRGIMDANLQLEANFSDKGVCDLQIDYNQICEEIIKNAVNSDQNTYLCGTTGYDDTPRRGMRGEVMINSSPQEFYSLMKILLYLSKQRGNEFIFVNAWNEWGEGMHLEPDQKYKFLERDEPEISIQLSRYKKNWESTWQADKQNKYKNIMRLYDKWLFLRERKVKISDYLIEKNYKKIAIYGMGKVSKHLLFDLENSDIEVMYGIDRVENGLNYSFPIYNLDGVLPPVDVIIGTVVYEFDNIYKILREKSNSIIISLEEIIDCL